MLHSHWGLSTPNGLILESPLFGNLNLNVYQLRMLPQCHQHARKCYIIVLWFNGRLLLLIQSGTDDFYRVSRCGKIPLSCMKIRMTIHILLMGLISLVYVSLPYNNLVRMMAC